MCQESPSDARVKPRARSEPIALSGYWHIAFERPYISHLGPRIDLALSHVSSGALRAPERLSALGIDARLVSFPRGPKQCKT
jgi:hypothetical protein